MGHPHLLRHEFNPQHAAAAAAAAAAGGVYPPSGHFPPHPAPHHLHRPSGYHPPPAQGYPELVRHHQHHSANRPHALMEAGSASLPPRSSQPYQPHVPPAQVAFYYIKRSWYASAYSFGFLQSSLPLCRPFSSNSSFDALVNVYCYLVDPDSVGKCQ